MMASTLMTYFHCGHFYQMPYATAKLPARQAEEVAPPRVSEGQSESRLVMEEVEVFLVQRVRGLVIVHGLLDSGR